MLQLLSKETAALCNRQSGREQLICVLEDEEFSQQGRMIPEGVYLSQMHI